MSGYFGTDRQHKSFLNSHILVKREELHESWWALTSQCLCESFLNSHALVKRGQEFYESWQARVCTRIILISSHTLSKREQLYQRWQARVCMRVFSTLMPGLKENGSWEVRVCKSFINFRVLDKRGLELFEIDATHSFEIINIYFGTEFNNIMKVNTL